MKGHNGNGKRKPATKRKKSTRVCKPKRGK